MLFGYQREIVEDPARLLVANKSRRIGGSHAVTLRHAIRAVGARDAFGESPTLDPASGVDVYMIATEERKAADLLREAVRHVRTLEVAFGARLIAGQPTQTKCKLRNGRQLLALPAGNSNALHGWTGDVVIDECARIPDAYGVARAAFPVADETPRNPAGFQITAVSTPLAAAGLFYDLAEGERGAAWSKHTIPIQRAVAEGFPDPSWSIERRRAWLTAKRAEVVDPEVWASSYECSFLSAVGQLVSAELMDAALCHRSEIPTEGHGASGYDVARTRDASSIVSGIVDHKGVLWVVDCESRRGESWQGQMDWAAKIARRMGRLAIDATGIGSKPAEDLQRAVPGVMPVTFSSSTQREAVITGLRARFLTGKIRIPRDLTQLRQAILSWRREVTAGGNTRYVLPRNALGHSDEAVACALAAHVAPGAGGDVGRIVMLPDRQRQMIRSLRTPDRNAFVRPTDGRLYQTAREQTKAARGAGFLGGVRKWY